jgi:phage protein U
MNLDALSLIEAGARYDSPVVNTRLPPLLMWGDFVFQLSTMAYNKLTFSESWNWATQGRIGRRDSLQYTGQKAPTIRFDCELYAEFVDSTDMSDLLTEANTALDANHDPVEWLRNQASMKTPLMLVTGYGRVMGYWVMTQIDQSVDAFRGAGEFRHQAVTLSMQYYGNSLSGIDADPAQVDQPTGTQADQAASDITTFISEN